MALLLTKGWVTDGGKMTKVAEKTGSDEGVGGKLGI